VHDFNDKQQDEVREHGWCGEALITSKQHEENAMIGNSRGKNIALKRLFTVVVFVLTVTHNLACGEAISVEGVDPSGRRSGSLILSWTASTTSEDGTVIKDLAGYRLYYGTESGNYSHVFNVGNYTTFEMSDPAPDT
jgi:hypothetical protein